MDHGKPKGHRPFPGQGKPFLREFGMELVESQTWPKLEKSTHKTRSSACTRQWINTTFVQQLVPDVHQKLQKLEGLTGMDIDQLIDIAIQVVANLEEVAKKEKEKDVEWKKSKNDGAHIAHSGKFRHPEAHRKEGFAGDQ